MNCCIGSIIFVAGKSPIDIAAFLQSTTVDKKPKKEDDESSSQKL